MHGIRDSLSSKQRHFRSVHTIICCYFNGIVDIWEGRVELNPMIFGPGLFIHELIFFNFCEGEKVWVTHEFMIQVIYEPWAKTIFEHKPNGLDEANYLRGKCKIIREDNLLVLTLTFLSMHHEITISKEQMVFTYNFFPSNFKIFLLLKLAGKELRFIFRILYIREGK